MTRSREEKLLSVAQEYASDLAKRRWPARYVGRMVMSHRECISALIEMGAIDQLVVDAVGRKMALMHWFLSFYQAKDKKDKQTSTSFYRSKAWRSVRYSVLAQSNKRCQLCGSSASDGITLHVDHIKPRSKYPELALDVSNLRVICEDCNIGKSDTDCFE